MALFSASTSRCADKDRVGKVFAFAANTVTSGVIDGVEKNPTFAAFIARAGQEYAAHSATPGDYDAFVDQISKMWAQQPNWSDAELKAIDTPVLIVDGDHDEAIKRAHTEYIAATIPHAGQLLILLPTPATSQFLQDPRQFNFAVLHFLGDEKPAAGALRLCPTASINLGNSCPGIEPDAA